MVAASSDGAKNADSRAQCGCDEGELKGEQRSLEEGWPSFEDRGEIQVEVHRS